MCLDRIRMLGRFRIIKLLISWDILENFPEEVVRALYLKKKNRVCGIGNVKELGTMRVPMTLMV